VLFNKRIQEKRNVQYWHFFYYMLYK
jgi:hypothetical protein